MVERLVLADGVALESGAALAPLKIAYATYTVMLDRAAARRAARPETITARLGVQSETCL